MSARPDEAQPQGGRFSRRSLIATSAGVATTVAVTAVNPTAALARPDGPPPPVGAPTTPMPANPVAYVHDAARGGDRPLGHGRAHLPGPGPGQAPARRRRLPDPALDGGQVDVLARRSPRNQPGRGGRQHRRLRLRQPDKPSTVTVVSNYIPFELPSGGPNFYEFGDDVLYSLHISNSGQAAADITYDFLFETRIADPDTFLYNTGAITSLGDPNFNKRQFYSVIRTVRGRSTGLPCPPATSGSSRPPTTAATTSRARPMSEPVARPHPEHVVLDVGGDPARGQLHPAHARRRPGPRCADPGRPRHQTG